MRWLIARGKIATREGTHAEEQASAEKSHQG
jgi:hypothetical protein